MKFPLKSALGALALGLLSTPASAVVTISVPCANTDITPTALDCAGFVAGNVVNGNDDNELIMAELLLELGFVYNGDENGLEQVFSDSDPVIDFNTLLTGMTIIGVHYGNGTGSSGGQGSGDDTAFYLLDAGMGLDILTLNFGSSSTVTLFQTGGTAVPEPATWAMMLMGFGAAGFAMRRRRRTTTGISQLA